MSLTHELQTRCAMNGFLRQGTTDQTKELEGSIDETPKTLLLPPLYI